MYCNRSSKLKSKEREIRYRANSKLNQLYYAKTSDIQSTLSKGSAHTQSKKELDPPRSISTQSNNEKGNKIIKPFYIKKSEKKLTVPSEPKLNTNDRAARRESIKKDESF